MEDNARGLPRSRILCLLVLLSLWTAAQPVEGCISADEADIAARAARYREEQAALVGPLTTKASTIVVAVVLREVDKTGWVHDFEIRQVLKGTIRTGAKIRYQGSLSVIDTPCTPAEATFYNTVVFPDDEYLLYASGDRLLRATSTKYTHGLTVEEEADLIKHAIETNGAPPEKIE